VKVTLATDATSSGTSSLGSLLYKRIMKIEVTC
jgi:hypothetical protein